MPLTSMTGYADHPNTTAAITWTWEARSVNGRGLDLRLRLPEGFESLDPPLRQAAAAVLTRGSVTVALRVARAPGSAVPRLRPEALAAAIAAARATDEAAAGAGLDLAPVTAADLLALRGVMEAETAEIVENRLRADGLNVERVRKENSALNITIGSGVSAKDMRMHVSIIRNPGQAGS